MRSNQYAQHSQCHSDTKPSIRLRDDTSRETLGTCLRIIGRFDAGVDSHAKSIERVIASVDKQHMHPQLFLIKRILDPRGVVRYTADITEGVATGIRLVLEAGGAIGDIVRIVEWVERICTLRQ